MKNYQDRNWLTEHYVNQKLSMNECAKASGHPIKMEAVRHWLNKHNISRRDGGLPARVDINQAWLIEHYINQRLSMTDCGALLDPPVFGSTIRHYLIKYGIPTREVGSHMQGERNNRHGKPLSDATREKICNASTGRPRSEESRRKQSESTRGEKSPLYGKRTHGKGSWVVQADGIVVYMRSRWEVRFVDWLIDHGKEWAYEPETFILPDGRAYTPDFLSAGVYYEIKGYMSNDDRTKIEALRAMRPDLRLEVLDRAALLSLGVDLTPRLANIKHVQIVAGKTKLCELCGASFVPDNNRQRFCSRVCGSRSHRSNPHCHTPAPPLPPS